MEDWNNLVKLTINTQGNGGGGEINDEGEALTHTCAIYTYSRNPVIIGISISHVSWRWLEWVFPDFVTNWIETCLNNGAWVVMNKS